VQRSETRHPRSWVTAPTGAFTHPTHPSLKSAERRR
jgi:hypothetical protein